MRLHIDLDKKDMGVRAARYAVTGLQAALATRKRATLVVATAPSQNPLFDVLLQADLEWSKITIFHLDEYVGMSPDHPASFVGILRKTVIGRLPSAPAAFHGIDGLAEPVAECRRLGELIAATPVDVACIGIGENAHLAFNDPPADFASLDAYRVVTLDEGCRKQQLGEGWFPTFDAVPQQAISMSIRQILSAGRLVCCVPDARKAMAVAAAVEGPLTPDCPASALRTHPDCELCVDEPAAEKLSALVRDFSASRPLDE